MIIGILAGAIRAALSGGPTPAYATWSLTDQSGRYTLSSDLLTSAHTSGGNGHSLQRATQAKRTGKWYFEISTPSGDFDSGDGVIAGLVQSSTSLSTYPGSEASTFGMQYRRPSGTGYYTNGAFTLIGTGSISGIGPGVVGFAVDLDSRGVWVWNNAFWANGKSPDTHPTDPLWTIPTGVDIVPAFSQYFDTTSAPTGQQVLNTGQSAFQLTALPSGFNPGWYYVGEQDPLWSRTITLLQFNEGPLEARPPADSTGRRTWSSTSSSYRTVALGDTFGNAGNFDGSWALDTPASNDLKLRTGDFTIEFRCKPSSDTPAWSRIAENEVYDSSTRGWHLSFNGYDAGGFRRLGLQLSNGGGGGARIDTDGALSTSTPSHVAIERQGNTIRMYVNGVVQSTTMDATGIDLVSNKLRLGATLDGFNFYRGWIDEFRITKGYARYGGAFTPPTEPLPSAGSSDGDPLWDSVTSLINPPDVEGTTTVVDAKGVTWTPVGTVAVDNFYGYPAWNFDGSGARLSAAASAAFGFGAGDYTVEAILRMPHVADAYEALIDTRTASVSGIGWYAYGAAGGAGADWKRMLLANDAAIIARSSGYMPTDVVTHVALVRASGTVKLYIGGVEQFSVADARTMDASAPAMLGANYIGSQPFLGRILAFRVTKGVARYTAAFVPPSAPFPAHGV